MEAYKTNTKTVMLSDEALNQVTGGSADYDEFFVELVDKIIEWFNRIDPPCLARLKMVVIMRLNDVRDAIGVKYYDQHKAREAVVDCRKYLEGAFLNYTDTSTCYYRWLWRDFEVLEEYVLDCM